MDGAFFEVIYVLSMDKNIYELEQEITRLRSALITEKTKKADEILLLKLVYSSIIFVLLFIALMALIDTASVITQWVCIISFGFVALLAVGMIFNSYYREIKDAENV